MSSANLTELLFGQQQQPQQQQEPPRTPPSNAGATTGGNAPVAEKVSLTQLALLAQK